MTRKGLTAFDTHAIFDAFLPAATQGGPYGSFGAKILPDF